MGRKINRIKIGNFRQYKDLEVKIPSDKNKNLAVIIGNNRYGKTNFLNSLLWCLYGREGIHSEGSDSSMHFIKNERFPNNITEVSISLEDSDSGEVSTIKREDNKLNVTQKKPTDRTYTSMSDLDAQREIKTILPESVKNLFLFKGEFLDTFFENTSNDFLKDTIKNVSKIDKLEAISKSLKILESEYLRNIEKQNKNDDNMNKLNKKLEKYDEVIESEKAKITQLSLDIKNNRKEIDEIDKALRQMDQEKINSLMKRESDLNQQRERSLDRISKNKRLISDFFLEDISKWFLFKSLVDFNKYTHKLSKDRLLPPPASPELLNMILRDKKCICGSVVNEDMKKELNDLLLNYPKDGKMEKIYALSLSLDLDINKFDRIYSKIKEVINDNYEEEKNLKELNSNLKELSGELIGLDKDTIHKIAVKRELSLKELEKLQSEKEEAQVNLGMIEKDRAETDTALKLHISRSGTNKELSNKLNLCSLIRKKIDNLSNNILGNISEEINKKTIDYFKKIFWNNYQHINYNIKINESFEVEVISPQGNNMIYQLSTGEKKVLALSFIAALSDFYGFDFPIIIDAPFTALQKEVTSKMLETLIELSKTKQIIILTIPHDETVMSELNKFATIVYSMTKDREDNTSVEVIRNG